jgi:hypothetical protein
MDLPRDLPNGCHRISYCPPPNRNHTPLKNNSGSLTSHGQYSVRLFVTVRMTPDRRCDRHFPDTVIPFAQLPPANCFSLEVMLLSVIILYATIYMCSQPGIAP